MSICEHCGSELDWRARSDARFCSTRCRVAHHRATRPALPSLPAELTTRDRWLRHVAKRPITASGAPASCSDPATWCSHSKAAASKKGDGLGFALNGDGIVCIDLDHCLTDGRLLTPSAAFALMKAPATYIEISPSGDGLHIWGRAKLDAARVRPGVEIYGDGRYMTVTGNRWMQCPSTLGDLSDLIRYLEAR